MHGLAVRLHERGPTQIIYEAIGSIFSSESKFFQAAEAHSCHPVDCLVLLLKASSLDLCRLHNHGEPSDRDFAIIEEGSLGSPLTIYYLLPQRHPALRVAKAWVRIPQLWPFRAQVAHTTGTFAAVNTFGRLAELNHRLNHSRLLTFTLTPIYDPPLGIPVTYVLSDYSWTIQLKKPSTMTSLTQMLCMTNRPDNNQRRYRRQMEEKIHSHI